MVREALCTENRLSDDFAEIPAIKDIYAIERDLAAEIKSCSQQVLHDQPSRQAPDARRKTLPK